MARCTSVSVVATTRSCPARPQDVFALDSQVLPPQQPDHAKEHQQVEHCGARHHEREVDLLAED
jgi:hypothetical protein